MTSIANELHRCLSGDSFAASPANILQGIDDTLAHREFPGVPRTIYAEMWHIAFWQQISLDWVRRIETPNPGTAAAGFPSAAETAAEPSRFEQLVKCPSPAGHPTRTMSVREQLESLLGHNAYHFGRIVLMRQMAGSWPPPSGGFTW